MGARKKKEAIEPANYPKGLAEALLELPHVEVVYIKGDQWHFVKREGWTAVDREDILEAAFPDEEAEEIPPVV